MFFFANRQTEYLLIEHFLLLASPGDRLLDDVDSLVVLRVDDATVPCERRVFRKQDRSANESAALRKYYHSNVWPAYEKYTLKRLQRLKTAGLQRHVDLMEVDASRQTPMLVLSEIFQRLWLTKSACKKQLAAAGLPSEKNGNNAVESALRSSSSVRVGFKLFYCEVRCLRALGVSEQKIFVYFFSPSIARTIYLLSAQCISWCSFSAPC